MLDGLVAHGTGIEPTIHYADTGGSSDRVFGLAHHVERLVKVPRAG